MESGSHYRGKAALAAEVKNRRLELQLGHSGLARRGGPSHETVRLIEAQERDALRDMTMAQLDRALGWRQGTAKAVWNGTAPADRDEWLADPVTADLEARAEALRQTGVPGGMEPLPVSLDNVSDIELAGELVSRLTRGGTAPENARLLGELLGLLTRRSDGGVDTRARSA